MRCAKDEGCIAVSHGMSIGDVQLFIELNSNL